MIMMIEYCRILICRLKISSLGYREIISKGKKLLHSKMTIIIVIK